MVRGTRVLPALGTALAFVFGHGTAHVVVGLGRVLEHLLAAALVGVLLTALFVVLVLHVLEHLAVTLGTARQVLELLLLTTLVVLGRVQVVDVLLQVTLFLGLGLLTQGVALEGALELLAALDGQGVVVLGVGLAVLEDQVFSTTVLEALVFLVAHLHDLGALVHGGRVGRVVAEAALEVLGTAGLVLGLVILHDHRHSSRSSVKVEEGLAVTVGAAVATLLAALLLKGRVELHVLGQTLAVLVLGLLGTQTHLTGPALVPQAGAVEVLLDVQEVQAVGTVAEVLVLPARLGAGVGAGRELHVLLALLVGTGAGRLDLLLLVALTVDGLLAVGREEQLVLRGVLRLIRAGTVGFLDAHAFEAFTILGYGIGTVRLVLLHLLVLVARAHLGTRLGALRAFGREDQLVLGGVLLLIRAGAGGHQIVFFPAFTLDGLSRAVGGVDHVLGVFAVLIVTRALGLLDLLLLVALAELVVRDGGAVGGVEHVFGLLAVLVLAGTLGLLDLFLLIALAVLVFRDGGVDFASTVGGELHVLDLLAVLLGAGARLGGDLLLLVAFTVLGGFGGVGVAVGREHPIALGLFLLVGARTAFLHQDLLLLVALAVLGGGRLYVIRAVGGVDLVLFLFHVGTGAGREEDRVGLFVALAGNGVRDGSGTFGGEESLGVLLALLVGARARRHQLLLLVAYTERTHWSRLTVGRVQPLFLLLILLVGTRALVDLLDLELGVAHTVLLRVDRRVGHGIGIVGAVRRVH